MSTNNSSGSEAAQAFLDKKKLTAQDFKEKLGLESRENVGDNFNSGATDSDGTKSNPLLGKGYMSDEDFKRLKGDKNFQDLYMKHGDKSWQNKDGDYSFDEMSINHMDGFLDKFGDQLVTEDSAPKEDKPIEYSPEILQAKDRIKVYEEDILTGKTSNSIFGGGATDLRGNYELNLSEGQAGIGTENSGADVGGEATKSFLDSKKAEVKNQYKFIPK